LIFLFDLTATFWKKSPKNFFEMLRISEFLVSCVPGERFGFAFLLRASAIFEQARMALGLASVIGWLRPAA